MHIRTSLLQSISGGIQNNTFRINLTVCAEWNCSSDQWKCKKSLKCIPRWGLCNGNSDCRSRDTSDEDLDVCKQERVVKQWCEKPRSEYDHQGRKN